MNRPSTAKAITEFIKLAGLALLMLLSLCLLDACSRDQGRQEIRSVVSQ